MGRKNFAVLPSVDYIEGFRRRPVYGHLNSKWLSVRVGPFSVWRVLRRDRYGMYYWWYGRKIRVKLRIPASTEE